MKRNGFWAVMLNMVLAFGLMVIGCVLEDTDPSVSISGTAKVGKTMTATVTGNTSWGSDAGWQAFDDAACTTISTDANEGSFGGVPQIGHSPSTTLRANTEGKWIRAYVESGGHKFYSNILGPVEAPDNVMVSFEPDGANSFKLTLSTGEWKTNPTQLISDLVGQMVFSNSFTGGGTLSSSNLLQAAAVRQADTKVMKVTLSRQTGTAAINRTLKLSTSTSAVKAMLVSDTNLGSDFTVSIGTNTELTITIAATE